MKFKKISAGLMAVALMATIGANESFASTENSTIESNRSFVESRINKRKQVELTEEQKELLEAKMEKMNASHEKWTALTDAQKEGIYLLKDEIGKIEEQIIDKYLEFGVIDEEMTKQMKERLSESRTSMREAGRMPMIGRKGGVGRKGFKGSAYIKDSIK